MAQTHVVTVTCPNCNRPWTGHFPVDVHPDDIKKDDKVCKDCKR